MLFCQAADDTPKGNRVTLRIVSQEKVKERLDQYGGDDSKSEVTLRQMFLDAGCPETRLSEQQVPHRKQPNVICEFPGSGEERIVVGAHFDHVREGTGIVDNWSGASLLPSLLQSINGTPRKHTYVFVGFSGEEEGFLGSEFYVKQLRPEQLANTKAMVNLDTLGLGPTLVWTRRSDPELLKGLLRTAQTLKVPLSGMNVDGVGESDEYSFIQKNICTITVHSVTPATLHVLHTAADNPSAIRFSDYYDSYRLPATYLAVLDNAPAERHVCAVTPSDH